MQEHVELEVSLEIIMARIADCIINFKDKKDESKLKELIELEEKAYQGDKQSVEKILGEF